MKDLTRRTVFAAALSAALAPAAAQERIEATVQADVVSRYVWRGQDLGDVSLQPTLGLAYKGLSLTAWGNVGLSDPSDTEEFDLTLAYSTGGFNIGVTDYPRGRAVVHQLRRQRRTQQERRTRILVILRGQRAVPSCRMRLDGGCWRSALRHEFLLKGQRLRRNQRVGQGDERHQDNKDFQPSAVRRGNCQPQHGEGLHDVRLHTAPVSANN